MGRRKDHSQTARLSRPIPSITEDDAMRAKIAAFEADIDAEGKSRADPTTVEDDFRVIKRREHPSSVQDEGLAEVNKFDASQADQKPFNDADGGGSGLALRAKTMREAAHLEQLKKVSSTSVQKPLQGFITSSQRLETCGTAAAACGAHGDTDLVEVVLTHVVESMESLGNLKGVKAVVTDMSQQVQEAQRAQKEASKATDDLEESCESDTRRLDARLNLVGIWIQFVGAAADAQRAPRQLNRRLEGHVADLKRVNAAMQLTTNMRKSLQASQKRAAAMHRRLVSEHGLECSEEQARLDANRAERAAVVAASDCITGPRAKAYLRHVEASKRTHELDMVHEQSCEDRDSNAASRDRELAQHASTEDTISDRIKTVTAAENVFLALRGYVQAFMRLVEMILKLLAEEHSTCRNEKCRTASKSIEACKRDMLEVKRAYVLGLMNLEEEATQLKADLAAATKSRSRAKVILLKRQIEVGQEDYDRNMEEITAINAKLAQLHDLDQRLTDSMSDESTLPTRQQIQGHRKLQAVQRLLETVADAEAAVQGRLMAVPEGQSTPTLFNARDIQLQRLLVLVRQHVDRVATGATGKTRDTWNGAGAGAGAGSGSGSGSGSDSDKAAFVVADTVQEALTDIRSDWLATVMEEAMKRGAEMVARVTKQQKSKKASFFRRLFGLADDDMPELSAIADREE